MGCSTWTWPSAEARCSASWGPTAAVPGVSEAAVDGRRATCTVHGDIAPLLSFLSEWQVSELDSRELSLEEVFVTEFAGAPRA